MRQALAQRGRRMPRWMGGQGLAVQPQQSFLPAPTSGWDTDTPIAELPLTRSRQFENFIPRGVAAEMRKGYSEHVTGLGTKVETLMAYQAGATSTLFAAAGTAIYNVTSAGAVGAAVVTGQTNARWRYVNMTTSGGSFLWICNGADAPYHWNGTAWANPSLTTTTYAASSIKVVSVFKERLLVAFKDTLVMGYFSTQAISGTISNFPLGAVFNYGGSLVDIGSLSRDGGAGMDDFAVFLTSEGEAAVYQGTNPGDANAWALVGVYYVGEPVGDRPLVELGDDLGVMTLNGLVSLKTIMSGSEQVTPPLTVTIGSAWQAAANAGQSFNGWEGIYVPTEELLIINAPTSATVSNQFIRHRVTGGWGKFTEWNFSTFEFFNGVLYAGGTAGNVYKCFDGYDDNGSDITGRFKTAWSSANTPLRKTFLELQTLVSTTTRAAYRFVLRTDFNDSTPSLPGFPVSTLTGALIWGSGLWNTGLWGGIDATAKQWRATSGEGFNASVIFECRSNQSRFSVNGFNLRYVVGGGV